MKNGQIRNPFKVGKFRRLTKGRRGKCNNKRNVINLNQEEIIIPRCKEEAKRIIETSYELGIQLTKNMEVLEVVKDQLLKGNIRFQNLSISLNSDYR